jgi:hypothetical protein
MVLVTCDFSTFAPQREGLVCDTVRTPYTVIAAVNLAQILVMAMAITVSGCSSDSGAALQSKSEDSLYAEKSVSIRAVVVTRAQRPYPLESLEIRASPASKVAPLLKQATEEHGQQVAAIQDAIDVAYTKLREREQRLATAKVEVANQYNESVGGREQLKNETSRDDLDSLSSVRSKKSAAVKSFEDHLAIVIRPIEQKIMRLRSDCQSLESELAGLREGYNKLLFESLPFSPTKMWVTDVNGSVSITLPQTEPWYLWAATTRDVPGLGTESYQWLLVLPDDLDDNGKLFFDHRNLLDNRGLALDQSTGYLHKESKSRGSGE